MKIKNLATKISERIRAKYYSFSFDIGNGCSFGKLRFHDCEKDSIKIGKNVTIYRYTELCAKRNLPIIVGEGSFINQRCIVRANTTIGKKVNIGPNVMFITDDHELGTKERRAGASRFPPINIGDGCWIGASSTILGGVTIGEGTVIGAGSLVNKDCEPNSVYAGVPAKLIRRID